MSPNLPSPWPEEPSPSLPHLSGEFLLWLWWRSDVSNNRFSFGDEEKPLDLWVDTRISFKAPGEDKAATVLTGENPAAAREARAALMGGKILQEIRVGMRREDREFYVTLKAPDLDLAALQLPQVVKGDGEEAIYDRMFLYEEAYGLVSALFSRFIQVRTSPEWESGVHPQIRAWVGEGAGEGDELDGDGPDGDELDGDDEPASSADDSPPWDESSP